MVQRHHQRHLQLNKISHATIDIPQAIWFDLAVTHDDYHHLSSVYEVTVTVTVTFVFYYYLYRSIISCCIVISSSNINRSRRRKSRGHPISTGGRQATNILSSSHSLCSTATTTTTIMIAT